MLSVKNVTKYYGDLLAVDDLSFDIFEGEIFGLLGVNGSGKTTTFRMIMGLLDKSKGEIFLNNKKIDYSVTDSIGFLTEERSLLLNKTVLEQAYLYGTLKGMKSKDIEEKLDKYLKEFKIEEYKNKKIKELSKGNQQKIQFIMSILHSPKLLILDEPFSGLDPINVDMFKKVILRLKKEKTIIIFSSHMMEHIEYFCDSLIILVKGKSVLQGKLSKIKSDYKTKNIIVEANVDEAKINKIKGVISVEKTQEKYTIKVEDIKYVSEVFKEISKCDNVTKFVVEEPTLNEIFISKVGEAYEN
ncbi:MAG: ATP-binding cassette domain-containing protein [Tenericutes bacterium]|nr:ATP-binding cassette domain-containing protein [Mycoplasmatota bacterium]